MKKQSGIMFLGAAIAIAALSGCGLWGQTEGQQLLAKSEDTALPRTAADKIQNATLVYSVVTANHPDLTVTIRYLAPDHYRYDFRTDDAVASVCLDGDRSWAYSSDRGVLSMAPERIEELRNEIMILPFRRNFDARFKSVRKTGEAEVNGAPCWVLSCEPGKQLTVDEPVKLYIDRKSGLLVQTESVIGGKLHRTELFDYRDFDGVKLATAIYESSPRGVIRTKLISADWSTPVPATVFNPPKALGK